MFLFYHPPKKRFLHKHNIVHRDVKGANILVHASNGVVKLADFNSSTRIQSLAMVSGSIKDMKLMSLKGTPSYMAPEVQTGTLCH